MRPCVAQMCAPPARFPGLRGPCIGAGAPLFRPGHPCDVLKLWGLLRRHLCRPPLAREATLQCVSRALAAIPRALARRGPMGIACPARSGAACRQLAGMAELGCREPVAAHVASVIPVFTGPPGGLQRHLTADVQECLHPALLHSALPPG